MMTYNYLYLDLVIYALHCFLNKIRVLLKSEEIFKK